jgi:hypothetical protein
MIIKGIEHNNAGNLARYLLSVKENEQPSLWELRDSASDDLADSLTDWELIGRCKTKGSKILYHSHIRLCDGESLNEAQWRETIQSLEQKLGFTNCPRAIVGHHNFENGLHVHIVWSRFDPSQKSLVKLSNDHQHHHSVAREAEKEYGLRPAVEPQKENTPRKRRVSDRNLQAIKERGGDKERLAKLLQAAWATTDSGQEMRAMLKSLKVELLPGDRRDWVVEYRGLKLNPVRLLADVNTAKFRERMQDVNLAAEKQKQYEAEAMKMTFRRKAEKLLKVEIDAAMQAAPATPKGFRKAGKRVPQPKLRRKGRYEDPEI